MKNLTEMSDQELLKLREQLNSDLDESDDDFNETDFIEALQGLDEIKEAKQPGEKQGAPKSPPKGYPSDKGKYADPTNFKYPLDTEAHVRAALSYFSKSKNRSGYSSQEQKFMWKRIIAAAKKYDIELGDDVKKHGEKLGEADSSFQEVNREMDEKEIVDLITKTIKEQMKPTGQAPGTMETYTPKVKVPPDIEAINTQLENFKQMHAKHEAANTDMSTKVAALTKQVSDMNEAFQKMQKSMQSEAEDNDSDSDDSDADSDSDSDDGQQEMTEAKKSTKAAKPAKTAKGAKGASTTEEDNDSDSDDSDSDSDDDDGDGDGKNTGENKTKESIDSGKKKVKEQAQVVAAGLVATDEMTKGTGVTPPGFGPEHNEDGERSFADAMEGATKMQKRRLIGG